MSNKEDKGGPVSSDNAEDLFGTNNEIALKLKQFYSSVQEEEIPNKLLDLLEKLDHAEESAGSKVKAPQTGDHDDKKSADGDKTSKPQGDARDHDREVHHE